MNIRHTALTLQKWVSSIWLSDDLSWWLDSEVLRKFRKLSFTLVPLAKARVLCWSHTFTDNTLRRMHEPSGWMWKSGSLFSFAWEMLFLTKSSQIRKYSLCILTFWLTYVPPWSVSSLMKVPVLHTAVYHHTQDKQCMYKYNTEAHSHNHCCHAKARTIKYSEYVSRALVIHHAQHMGHIILPLSHKWYNCQKKSSWPRKCVSIFSTPSVWNISHSKKNSVRYYHKCTHICM